MKIVKTLLFAIVATCFFGSANAQIRVKIGEPARRPVHRRVVVVHHPVHHHRRHVIVRHR